MKRWQFSVALIASAVLLANSLALGHSQSGGRFGAAVEEGRRALRELVASGRAPGIGVAVAVGGAIVWSEGFGLANLEHAVPVTSDTRFGIGSISKTFTMAAAVRLWERGAIDLDAPIERYLPDFPHKGRGVTIRRIAAHQSGLSDSFAADHYTTTRHFDELESAYREIKNASLDYEPGSKTVYATGLYTLIGRAIERADGRAYRTLMRDEVFDPAGTASVIPNDRRAIIPNRSGFYANRESGGFEHGAYFDPSFKLPGAGYLATAADIARFGSALLGQLLTDRGRAEMFRAVPLDDGTATPWALGIQVGADSHGRVWHIPGGGIGISSWLFIHPDTNLVIALLSNLSTAPVGGRAYKTIAAAFMQAAR